MNNIYYTLMLHCRSIPVLSSLMMTVIADNTLVTSEVTGEGQGLGVYDTYHRESS